MTKWIPNILIDNVTYIIYRLGYLISIKIIAIKYESAVYLNLYRPFLIVDWSQKYPKIYFTTLFILLWIAKALIK